MAKKVSRRTVFNPANALALSIPASVQSAVLIMLVVAWLGGGLLAGYSLMVMPGDSYTLLYFGMTMGLPLLFFATTLMYAWRRYRTLLHKLFISGVLATSGFAASQVFVSAVYTLINHFVWLPAGDAPTQTVQWLCMLLGYAAYVIVIGLLPHSRKKVE